MPYRLFCVVWATVYQQRVIPQRRTRDPNRVDEPVPVVPVTSVASPNRQRVTAAIITHDSVRDFGNLRRIRALGCPAIIDAGHASNDPAEIPMLAQAGVAAGADGLFIECHPEPRQARCDSSRTIALDLLERLLPRLVALAALVQESERG